MKRHIYNPCVRLGLGLLLLVVPAAAQLKVGDDLSMTVNGTVGVGYNGEYGNTELSDHSSAVNSDLNLTGYFYNPNFLNFYARPIYNRTQDDSGNAAIVDTTSLTGGAGIFSGSHFPGSIAYGRSFQGTGTFGLPEIPGYTTHGSANNFSVGWAELMPHLPPVSAQYMQTTSSTSLFGTDEDQHSNSRNFNVGTGYTVEGWRMSARWSEVWASAQLPSVLTAGESEESYDHSKNFLYNAIHKMPLKGSAAFSYSYGDFSGDGNGLVSTGSNNTLTGTVSLIPWRRLSTTFGVQYDTNLTGAVQEQLLNAGAIAPEVNFGSNSHSLSMYNFDTYTIGKGLSATFGFNRTDQEAYGRSLSANHFSAILNYHFDKPLWGAFTVYGGVNDQSSDAGHQGTGLVAGVNFNKVIKNVEWSGSFAYAQEVETVLATDVTSTYTYLASARKRLSRHWRWNNNFHGYHSGLSDVPGLSNHSESFGTNLTYRNYALGGNYSRSFGTALLTANGLAPAPVSLAPVLGSDQYLLATGSAFGIGASMNPIRRWTVSANYSRSLTNTQSPTLISSGSSKIFTSSTTIQFRKISATGGYTHLMQGFGESTGSLPANLTTFYVGIQRWFHPF